MAQKTSNAQRPTSNAEIGKKSAKICESADEILSHRRDHLEFDRNWCGKRCYLNRCARRIRLARPGEMLGVQAVVDWKIFFHVCEKRRHIDDVLPRRAGIFQNEPHVLKHGATLRFDVVTDDVASRIERHAGDLFATA